jgi:hypothetical protein
MVGRQLPALWVHSLTDPLFIPSVSALPKQAVFKLTIYSNQSFGERATGLLQEPERHSFDGIAQDVLAGNWISSHSTLNRDSHHHLNCNNRPL